MSWLRKFLGRDRTGAISARRQEPPSADALGALHLRKLFVEYYNMPPDETKEQHLVKMLPVFCKLFAGVRPNEIGERFGEVSVFARDVSLLLVAEIKRHAMSTDTQEASASLAHFLENHSDEGELSNGWNMLNTVNILSSCERAVVEAMASTTLPSTLVKSLYLFLDLPSTRGLSSGVSGSELPDEERNRSRRIDLHKVFTQALIRLCRHVSAAEDIMLRDDLTKLFGIITSVCPRHNHNWRKTASDSLITITRHALTPNVVSHIHNHGCIALCIRNMQVNRNVLPLEIVEMFVSVYSCLKDSCELTYLLLDDFRTAQGYRFLTEFLIGLETSLSEESQEAVRNMVLLVSSLVMCGFHDLSLPVIKGQPFQDSNFSVPEVANPGLSVKNKLAFQVLETGFLKAQSSHLCGVILDVIFNIYSSDPANYFILESEHTLPHFIERVHTKPLKIQEQVFKVLEYVSCSLNYVPIPEIISVSILLKTTNISRTLCVVLQSMIKLVSFNAKYQDVFRDMGVIDALVWNVQQHAACLKEGTESDNVKDTAEEEFIFLLMECLRVILDANEANGHLFRESGGARCVQNMVPYARSRRDALKLIQQLILLPGGHDDLGTLLGLMNSADQTAVTLKTDVLQAVQRVFNLAARTKALFREADGFVYVVSVLSMMGGSLSCPPISVWEKVDRNEMICLLRYACSVLNAAMQDEPANKHYFQENIGFRGLVKPFLYLGCFGVGNSVIPSISNSAFYQKFQTDSATECSTNFNAFVDSVVLEKFQSSAVYFAAELFRLLRDMALDTIQDQSPSLYPVAEVSKHQLNEIAHPGAVAVIVDLLPAIEANPVFRQKDQSDVGEVADNVGGLQLDEGEKQMYEEWAFGLQLEIVNTISQMSLSDRNAQSLCQAGLTGKLMERCGNALADEKHPLHAGLQRLFERLALQALSPADVRNFLRLGDPLNCASSVLADYVVQNQPLQDGEQLKQIAPNYSKPVEFSRIQSLVTIATLRDGGFQGPDSSPSFIEFDMNYDGYGYLYLPSVSSSFSLPGITVPTPSAVGSIGNIASVDRPFPPPNGLTFSAWVYVNKMGTVADQHPIRLLTMIRKMESADTTKTQHCLSISMTTTGVAVTVNDVPEPDETSGDSHTYTKATRAVFQYEGIASEGCWRHVVVVLSKGALLRSSSAALYVDGQCVDSVKLPYVAAGGSSSSASTEPQTSPTSPVSSSSNMVATYIGTRPKQRRISRLVWRLGPTYLLEEPVSASTILCIYLLGPGYCGTFQAPYVEATAAKLQLIEDAEFIPAPGLSGLSSAGELLGPLVAEDKVSFGLNAHAQSEIVFREFQQQYSDMDVIAVRKELGISRNNLDWPVHILYNTASHAAGPLRTFGAVVVSRSGVRTFHPSPIHRLLECVGGTSVLLSLIAMATTVVSFYASVKVLVCVLRGNNLAMNEMERNGGFGILGMLYKTKHHLLNSHIVHLTFSLVGTIDSDRECCRIPHITAFHDLLGNLEVWSEAAEELQRSLYNHLFELVTLSNEKHTNAEQLCDMQMVRRLLQVLHRGMLSDATIKSVANVLSALLLQVQDKHNILSFSQFLASLLPLRDLDESKAIQSEWSANFQAKATAENTTMESNAGLSLNDACVPLPDIPLGKRVHLRNVLLELLASLLHDEKLELETRMAAEWIHVVGIDWFLAFLQRNVHHTTVAKALRIIAVLLSHPVLQQKFREGTACGGWATGMSDTGGHSPVGKAPLERRPLSIPTLPGYQAMSYLLTAHSHCSHIFVVLLAILLGRNIVEIPMAVTFDLDGLRRAFKLGKDVPVQPVARNAGMKVNTDAAIVLLVILRSFLSEFSLAENSSTCEYPVILLHFLAEVYQSSPEFAAMCTGRDFIDGLTASVFPLFRIPLDIVSIGAEYVVVESEGTADDSLDMPSPIRRTSLIAHPAKQAVLELLRIIVGNNLVSAQSGKGFPVLDMILEASPDGCSSEQQSEFQTCFIHSLLDHLVVMEALSPNSPSRTKSNSSSQLLVGVTVVLNRVADRLWTGILSQDQGAVLMPVVQLMEQSKSGHWSLSLDDLYRPLNRIVLFLLSRHCLSVVEQTSVLETLHTVTRYQKLILSSANTDQEFLACLCHCLVCLVNGKRCSEPRGRSGSERTLSTPDDDDDDVSGQTTPVITEGNRLVQSSAARVWDIILECKQREIQDLFNVEIPKHNSRQQGPSSDRMGLAEMSSQSRSIKSLQGLFEEQAARVWMNYKATEYKKRTESTDSKRMTIVQRFTIFRQRGKEKSKSNVSQQVQDYLDDGAFVNLQLVQEVVELQRVKFQQNAMYMFNYMQSQWADIQSNLTRERGLWGPMIPSSLDKWMLDATEGPHRMRKKLCQNDVFYVHYEYNKNKEPEVQTKYIPPNSRDSELYYQLSLCRQQQSEVASITKFNNLPEDSLTTLVKLSGTSANRDESDTLSSDIDSNDCGSTIADSEDFDDVLGEPVQQQLHRLLEQGEKIQHKYPCARIEGLDVIDGLFLIGLSHFYIIDGLMMLSTGEISDIQSLPEESRKCVIPVQKHYSRKAMQPTSYPIHCHKWSFNDVSDLHKRRYLLMDIAIELFATNGRNQFVALGKADRNRIHSKLVASCRALSQESVLVGMKRNGPVEVGTGIFGSIIGEKSITQKWERGELSNFQYLMFLNTLAGRSYSDLMQYPVFPWVLKDYDSEELDLTSPETFRDFSKPMGAQTPERLKQFVNRYAHWEDTTGENTPPYYYGTHYSSAMTVASYLIRLEPFTQHFLRLQGGHFDIADRLFHSVKEGWKSASEFNMADVKELTPEFFYLPDFLLNSNNFDLGRKQNGDILGDVILPPWAKGDAQEFIRVHREALECDYVSAHLHEWIDLIFGYRQQGQAALEQHNVFHHLFYEGTVDIDKIEDPLTRNATIGFINNFGQMPKQLFKRPHPPRKVKPTLNLTEVPSVGTTLNGGPSSSSSDRLFYHHLQNLMPSLQPLRELKGPVGQIVQTDRGVLIAVEKNKILVPPHHVRYLAWGFYDNSIRGAILEGEKVTSVYENLHIGKINCMLCLDAFTLITAGESTVIYVWRLVTGSVRERNRQLQPKQTLYGHTAPVTCLVLSKSYSILVSGSEDQSCIIWDINRWTFVRQLLGHVAPIAAVTINNLTGDIVTCASHSVYLWSINGRLLADLTLPEGPRSSIQCCTVSELCEWDSQNVILTGGVDGVVRMFSVEFEPHISGLSKKEQLHCEADRRLTEIIREQMDDFGSSQSLLEQEDSNAGVRKQGQDDGTTDTCGIVSDGDNSDTKQFSSSSDTSNGGVDLENPELDAQSFEDGIGSSSRSDKHPSQRANVNPFLRKSRSTSGQTWRRVLAERAKLTMHTAIDRHDNRYPARISCLSVSRDHRTLLVGDERGRIYSWSVTESAGKRANHWVRDEVAKNCAACNVPFTLTERRHHCRDCGQIFCHKCSKYESKIERLGITKAVRVCQQCFVKLKSKKSPDPMRNI